MPQPALEARIKHVMVVVAKDRSKLKELVADHNRRVSTANESQLAVVRALEERRRASAVEHAGLPYYSFTGSRNDSLDRVGVPSGI